jgi:hypothetical protein
MRFRFVGMQAPALGLLDVRSFGFVVRWILLVGSF